MGLNTSLKELEKTISNCKKCPLHKKRLQAVPGIGPSPSIILVIGEAPGAKEDKLGLPFQGAAGSLLTKLLNGVGLDRNGLFITNLVKCRPPQNRPPTNKEIKTCAPYLKKQIILVSPKIILLLGAKALKAVSPDSLPISKVHGQSFRKDGIFYFPLYHPAAAIYNRSLQVVLVDDLIKVKNFLVTL